MGPLIKVHNLKKHYPLSQGSFLPGNSPWTKKQDVKAIDGVSFHLEAHKTLGIVGESGCGKSTLAKALIGLEPPSAGDIFYGEKPLSSLSPTDRRQMVQMIFQDPYSSLNPRKKTWRLIAEPLLINTSLSRKESYGQALNLMEKVGLRKELAHTYPHQLSGGQRQRVGIARALSTKPQILICDEPVSALDVSLQAQILNLLMELQEEMGLTILFIGHNLAVMNHIADYIMVLYLGKVVEYGKRQEIFTHPLHPYTQALLASSPNLSFQEGKAPTPIQGELPSPLNPPPGCAFHQRCPLATEQCSRQSPSLEFKEGRDLACFVR